MHHLIFSQISKEIARGRPLAALLMANQHLTATDPLRHALVKRALTTVSGQMKRYRPLRDVIRKVTDGNRIQDLNAEERAQIRGFREASRPLIADRYVPRPIRMQTRQGQIQQLRRIGR